MKGGKAAGLKRGRIPEVQRLLEVFGWIQEFGYVFLFLVLLAGLIGAPIPDEGVLVFAGVLIAKGTMTLIPAVAVSVAGVAAASLINYRLAAACGIWKLARWGRRIRFPVRRWKRSVRIMRKYGSWAVPFSYFIPGVRLGVSYGAGLLRLPLLNYVLSTFIGGCAWVSLYICIGYLFGS
jgi:membrane protein DedA with SNARE-associated domain